MNANYDFLPDDKILSHAELKKIAIASINQGIAQGKFKKGEISIFDREAIIESHLIFNCAKVMKKRLGDLIKSRGTPRTKKGELQLDALIVTTKKLYKIFNEISEIIHPMLYITKEYTPVRKAILEGTVRRLAKSSNIKSLRELHKVAETILRRVNNGAIESEEVDTEFDDILDDIIITDDNSRFDKGLKSLDNTVSDIIKEFESESQVDITPIKEDKGNNKQKNKPNDNIDDQLV